MRIMAPHRDKDYKDAAVRLNQYLEGKKKNSKLRDTRRTFIPIGETD